MSSYLQLVNNLIIETGSGLGTLSTVQSPAAGEATRMAKWIKDSWTEIQLEQYSWDFLRPTIQFTTTAFQQEYTEAAIMAIATNSRTGAPMSGSIVQQWVRKSFRCWRTSQGFPDEQILNFMTWDDFRNIYIYSTQRTNYQRPVIASVSPNDKSLYFGPIPDQATGAGDSYTITCEVWLMPQILSADADVPIMPAAFHEAITYKAMMKYGAYESAPEVYQRGKESLEEILPALYRDQLPVITSGPPMATDPR